MEPRIAPLEDGDCARADSVDGLWRMRHPLSLSDVPTLDAPWLQIEEFAATFNGYEHFGDSWRERVPGMRQNFIDTGMLDADLDDLRGALFCEFRIDRFVWGDDVTLSEPDGSGVRYVLPNPNFEQSPTQVYRRAIIARIRALLEQHEQRAET